MRKAADAQTAQFEGSAHRTAKLYALQSNDPR
jgi:hypothetical protein